MVTLVVLQKQGLLTRRLTVSAASVERAVQIARCGAEEARVYLPDRRPTLLRPHRRGRRQHQRQGQRRRH